MQQLSPHDLTLMFLSLGVLLVVARTFGEVMQWLHLPGVVGEILAGIMLGPTVFGTLAPGASDFIFPPEGSVTVVLDGMSNLAIVLFLLVAGMEVDLSTVWRQGPAAIRIGVTGTLIPFVVGFAVAWFAPRLLGRQPGADPLIFSLFFATAIAISALPIIAKILMDLNLYRSDFGMAVIAACVLNDLIGWMVFATILGLLDTNSSSAGGVPGTIAMTVGFAAFMLTLGRWAIHKTLPWLQVYTHWPGGVLSFALALALLGAAFTEWIGVHAIFGSFLVGIAVGDSSHLRERTRTTIDQFVSFIFAPLFFASIGLRVNFLTQFDLTIVAVVTLTAAIAKIGGCALGARWGRMPPRESLAIGFTMSSVGAMGIIIGLLALQNGLIRERLYVALVVMALLTSILSGPMTQFVLGRRKARQLSSYLSAKSFIPRLQAGSRREAITELAQVAAIPAGLDAVEVTADVWAREEMLHTGIGNGIAVPHARMAGLTTPVVAVGLSESGIDFDSPDGEPAHIIILILTGRDDHGAQIELLSTIGRSFRSPDTVKQALHARSVTEFLALIRSTSG